MSTDKASYTPGPWRCDSYKFVRQVDAPQHVICRLPTQYNSANQRLIAAAPDMLAALRRAALALAFAAESSKAMQDDYEAVSAAIAAATGAAP